MSEADFKSPLMVELRVHHQEMLAFRIEDRLTAGIPDIVLNGNGKTSWWEGKYLPGSKPLRISAIQHARCCQLEIRAHFCRYIIWTADKTLIVRPSRLAAQWAYKQDMLQTLADVSIDGHSMSWLAEHMVMVHRV